MKENDALTDMLRSRLEKAEMPVREGSWERLRDALPPMAATGGKRGAGIIPIRRTLYRVVAAAVVIFVLGGVWAAFWYFSPKEEIGEAFTQAAGYMPQAGMDTVHAARRAAAGADASPGGSTAQAISNKTLKTSGAQAPSVGRQAPSAGLYQAGMHTLAGGNGNDATLSATGTEAGHDGDETVSVHFSITITEQVYGDGAGQQGGYYAAGNPQAAAVSHRQGNAVDADAETASSGARAASAVGNQARHASKWALKAGIGTALPKGGYHAPLTAGITVERSLGSRVALEAGLQYHRMEGEGTTEHRLCIPLKADVLLASASRFDLYATAGAAVEKCVAGAPDNSFSAEPVQWSIAAGLGARYKLGDRFALFAEPTVTHHFSNASCVKTLRSERPTNLNLLCGVRMTY